MNKLLYFLFLFFPSICFSAYYGINLSTLLATKEPSNLKGYQLMLNYDPDSIKWRRLNLYFDGGFSHFWVNHSTYSSINIYSIASVIRYSLKKEGLVHPYLEASIGLSYLNKTRIESRNLGIHFAFQDRVGLGALLGIHERFSVGFHIVHYSNARLSGHNSGITVPIVLDVGYRFS